MRAPLGRPRPLDPPLQSQTAKVFPEDPCAPGRGRSSGVRAEDGDMGWGGMGAGRRWRKDKQLPLASTPWPPCRTHKFSVG